MRYARDGGDDVVNWWSTWLLIPRSRSKDSSRFIILSVRKILPCRATCYTERLIEDPLIIFYLSGHETIFYAFSGLDQVSK